VQRAGQRARGQEALVELEVLVAADALEGADVAVDVDHDDGIDGVDPGHLHRAGRDVVEGEEVDPPGHRPPCRLTNR